MHEQSKTTLSSGSSFQSIASTITIAAVLLGLVWFASRTYANRSSEQMTPETAAAQSWPTSPPTYTPQPSPTVGGTATPAATPTAIPTATPIPLPVWREISSLSVAEYTLSTVAQAESPAAILEGKFGTDQVVIKVVGKVRVGIDLNQIESTANGSSISVTLPPVGVQGVDLLPGSSEIVSAQQRWVLSDYPGLEAQAMEKGRIALESMVKNSASMLDLARRLTVYQIEDHLRGLGFTDIKVTFR